MIEVKGLWKSFSGKDIIKGVDATFEKGKCNMIIGASGTGKSVLLKNILYSETKSFLAHFQQCVKIKKGVTH